MLNDLSPSALKAAMKSGTASWGTWGSSTEHWLYVDAIPAEVIKHHWRMCNCGCRRKSRYAMKANGVALASGCELSMHKLVRQVTKSKVQEGNHEK